MKRSPAARTTAALETRLGAIEPKALAGDLQALGYARIPRLLDTALCAQVARWFFDESDQPLFRKTVDMTRHGYGDGTYRYFADPLPPLVHALRRDLYAVLAPIANDWCEQLKLDLRYPADLDAFLARCHLAGQTEPTPLVLRYTAGGYNRLHQDRYGPIAFPLQAVLLLSDPADFEGGEFLLVEGRARMQARGHALHLEQGDALVFAGDERPVESARGYARAKLRHGLSPLRAGERLALGIIFHDAT